MKRTNTIALALGLALSLAGTAGAQQQQQDRPGRPGRGGQFEGRGPRGGGPGGMLLKGITLTDAQKAQLKALREQDRAQFDAQREQARTRLAEARALREKGDTAALRRLHEQSRTERQAQFDRQATAVRGILTPAQRTQFDANVAEAKQRMAQRDSAGFDGRGKRGGREGHEGHGKRGARQG